MNKTRIWGHVFGVSFWMKELISWFWPVPISPVQPWTCIRRRSCWGFVWCVNQWAFPVRKCSIFWLEILFVLTHVMLLPVPKANGSRRGGSTKKQLHEISYKKVDRFMGVYGWNIAKVIGLKLGETSAQTGTLSTHSIVEWLPNMRPHFRWIRVHMILTTTRWTTHVHQLIGCPKLPKQ